MTIIPLFCSFKNNISCFVGMFLNNIIIIIDYKFTNIIFPKNTYIQNNTIYKLLTLLLKHLCNVES